MLSSIAMVQDAIVELAPEILRGDVELRVKHARVLR
jgi:hypothetical protein